MKAVQFKFGGDHAVVNIPKPAAAPDELVVKVKYSALDTSHIACLNKEMTGYFIHSLKEPLYLGYHYSGTIEEVGAEVDTSNADFVKGTDVFGHLQYEPSQSQGAFAEYITVKAQDCAIKPSGVSYSIAAASTTESLTALQAIRDLGGLVKGQHILIVGAGGGVGSAAVQIAKQLGVSVTAICSTKDVDQVQQWGADYVIDRTSNPTYPKTLLQQGERFDVILDAPNTLPSFATRLLKPKGKFVNTLPTSFTFLWNKVKTLLSSKKVAFVEVHSKNNDLDLVAKWLDEGDLHVPIDSTFQVKDMESAMTKHAGKKSGRVVIQVENGWI